MAAPMDSHLEVIPPMTPYRNIRSNRFCPGFWAALACLALITCLTLFHATPAQADQAREIPSRKTVLILHSYHKGFSWTDSIEEAVRETFKKALPRARVLTEYMDTKNHFNRSFRERLVPLYIEKFYNKGISLVICCDDNAFHFLRNNGEQIFGSIPMVFCGVNYFEEEMIRNHPQFTGVVESFDARSTLEAALALRPETRTIAVVVDKTPTGHSSMRRLSRMIPGYIRNYDFKVFDDVTMKDLLNQVALLDPQSLILLLNFNRDSQGQIFSHEETIQRLSSRSQVPIYGVWDFHMNHGLTGGMITSGRNQGATAARLALKILNGQDPKTIPVVEQSPNQWMFDFEQLTRFGLSDARLPQGSILINRPASFYEINKKIIWGLAAAIVFLVGIIFTLTINIIGRRRAQFKLRDTTEKLTSLLEALPIVPFSTQTRSGHVFLYVSRAVTGITGYQPESFTGDSGFWLNHIHPDDRPVVEKRLAGPDPFEERLTYRFLTSDGDYKWFSDTRRPVSYASGKSVRTAGFWQDITVEKLLRQQADERLQQVIQADKLASLGELVAGVAHEIRNPNAFISTNIPLLKETWHLLRPVLEQTGDQDSGLPEKFVNAHQMDEWCTDMDSMLEDIATGSERIDRVVRELNEFARSAESSDHQPLQVNDIIQKAQTLVGAQIRQTFDRFNLVLEPDLPEIIAHPTKLEQVVANLVVNATHAVRPHVKAELNIYSRQLEDPPAVLIQVEDNGQGIAVELRERIFEPFFTTRRETGGTGLGLSVCYRLVKEHQGAIFLVSRPGRGSRFTVALPVRPGQPVKIQPTILWVDEDAPRLESVLALARKMSGIRLIGLSSPDELIDRLMSLPQVLAVCLAGSMQIKKVEQLLEKMSEKRPLITRAVWCEECGSTVTEQENHPLADTVLSGPVTQELVQDIIHVNLRKIL